MYRLWYKCLSIFLASRYFQQATEHSESAHPDDSGWHTGILATNSLTGAGETSLALGSEVLALAVSGVHLDGLLNDEAVLRELANIQAGVRHGDLVDLIWVKPDLTLAALEHGGCETLLQLEGNHCDYPLPPC